jgi:transposase
MHISIRFTRPTIKLLVQRLGQAYTAGDLQVVRRTTALLLLADGKSKTEVAETLSVSRQTIHNWLTTFMVKGMTSLIYR